MVELCGVPTPPSGASRQLSSKPSTTLKPSPIRQLESTPEASIKPGAVRNDNHSTRSKAICARPSYPEDAASATLEVLNSRIVGGPGADLRRGSGC